MARSFKNTTTSTVFVAIIHGDNGSFIEGPASSFQGADDLACNYDDVFFDIEELGPGESLDLNIW